MDVAIKQIMGTLLIPLSNYRHLSVPESVGCHQNQQVITLIIIKYSKKEMLHRYILMQVKHCLLYDS